MVMWAGVVVVLSTVQLARGLLNSTSVIIQPDGFTTYPCWQVNHREQDLDNSILGLWYVTEIIEHKQDPKRSGTYLMNKCPHINLYKTTPKDIKLDWHEKSGDIHYSFRMTDPENMGFWLVWNKQEGTALNKGHEQFAGSVQVIESQPSRMVLTFCSNNRTHYSVIMVRNITIPHNTRDTHSVLEGYGLKVNSVQQTCRDVQDDSGAVCAVPSLALLLLSVLLLASWAEH